MSGIIRSVEEVVARIEEVEDGDWLGTERSDLVEVLPYQQALPFLKDGTTKDEWAEAVENVNVQAAAVDYLTFAIGKIVGHRGISAGRSVSHFRAWLWLLLPDDQVEMFECTPYPNYGAPQIKVAATLLDADEVWAAAVVEHPELERMAEGEPCTPDCGEGCGT